MIKLNDTSGPSVGRAAEPPSVAADDKSVAARNHDGERGASPNSKSAEGSTSSDAVGSPLQVCQRFFQSGFQSILQLVEIYSDRARITASRAILRGGLLAIGAVAMLVALAAAVLVTLRGLCGGFVALFGGRVWLGELVGGVFAITSIAVAIMIGMRFSERRDLRRLQSKYEQPQRENEAQNKPASTEDRARVPGSPRGADHGSAGGFGATGR